LQILFGNNRIINRQINSFSLYGQQTFSLGKNFALELSGFFSSPSIWAGVYQTKSLGNLDIALQKKFWKNNANLKIILADAFYTLPWRAVNEFAG
jgi:iron complex outermembrane recepter protein